MLSANSSMQNINGSVPNMHQVDRRHHCHCETWQLSEPKKGFLVPQSWKKIDKIMLPLQNMVNAVRRLPQIPQVGAVSTQVGPSQWHNLDESELVWHFGQDWTWQTSIDITVVKICLPSQESSSTNGTGLFSKLFRRSGNNPGLVFCLKQKLHRLWYF